DYLVGKQAVTTVRGRVWDSRTGKVLTADEFLSRVARRDTVDGWLKGGLVVKGAVADKIRKALDRKVAGSFNNTTPSHPLHTPASHAPKTLEKESGLTIQTPGKNKPGFKKLGETSPWDEKLNVKLSDVPLGAAFQLLEDTLDGYRIVVREYGLLIVPQDKVPP